MTFLLRIPIYRRSYKSVGAGEYILRLRGARRPALYASFAGAGARAPDSSSRQGWSAGSGSPGGRAPADRFARLVPRRLAVAAGSVRSLGQICPSCAPAWPRRSAGAPPAAVRCCLSARVPSTGCGWMRRPVGPVRGRAAAPNGRSGFLLPARSPAPCVLPLSNRVMLFAALPRCLWHSKESAARGRLRFLGHSISKPVAY